MINILGKKQILSQKLIIIHQTQKDNCQIDLCLMTWAKTYFITTIDNLISSMKGLFSNSLMINDIIQNRPKTYLITTINHHTSNTKGLFSNSLMINNMGKIRSYHNNRSQYVKL